MLVKADICQLMHLSHQLWIMATLLYGLPYTNLRKLQKVQNASARVLIQAKKNYRISITTVRKNIHWLPIKARIGFKILVLAWKACNGIGPKYLSDFWIKNTQHTILVQLIQTY